jgi:hypothetical protein
LSWNGSGTFSRLYSWVTRRDAGAPTNIIGALTMDEEFDNYKTGLENCVTRDGQNAASANLPMGTFRHTNVGAAALRTQYVRTTEAQDGTVWKVTSPAGTIDAMTGTIPYTASAYVAGMFFTIIAPGTGDNTVTTPTANFNAIGAKTIKKHQGALLAGDYSAGDTLFLLYDGTYLELLNPKYPNAVNLAGLTTDTTGGAALDFVAIVDASESNASNKTLVTDFMTNALGAVTTDTSIGATGDLVPFIDVSDSNAANKGTVDLLFANALQLLATDTTGGATGDLVALCDASESSLGNKTAVSDFVYNFITNGTADASPDLDADHVLTRDDSASAYKKVIAKNLALGTGADHIGFKGAPVVASDADATFALTDSGKTWYHTSGSTHTFTIPANASVAFPIGTIILLENENGGGNLTIAITSDTLRWTSSTGSRTLAANGSAAIKKVASTVWRLTGTNIT